MIAEKEYFQVNSEYFRARKSQCQRLIEYISNCISLRGKKFVSLGCGVCAELAQLAGKFDELDAVDTDASIIDFARKLRLTNVKFHNQISNIYLDRIADNSIDLIFALDVDSNLPVMLTIEQARRKLKTGGAIVLTERESNTLIYGRMFILPFIEEIQTKYSNDFEIKLFNRLNMQPIKEDRDNIVLLLKKRYE